MKKFFMAFTVLAAILISSAAQAAAFEFSTDREFLPDFYWARVVNCNEWISLRKYPSVEATRLAKIPLGTVVKIYRGMLGENSSSPRNGFYWTEYNGMHGWCLQEYISVGEHAGSW